MACEWPLPGLASLSMVGLLVRSVRVPTGPRLPHVTVSGIPSPKIIPVAVPLLLHFPSLLYTPSLELVLTCYKTCDPPCVVRVAPLIQPPVRGYQPSTSSDFHLRFNHPQCSFRFSLVYLSLSTSEERSDPVSSNRRLCHVILGRLSAYLGDLHYPGLTSR